MYLTYYTRPMDQYLKVVKMCP